MATVALSWLPRSDIYNLTTMVSPTKLMWKIKDTWMADYQLKIIIEAKQYDLNLFKGYTK